MPLTGVFIITCMAMLCKENGITAIGVCFILEVFPRKEELKRWDVFLFASNVLIWLVLARYYLDSLMACLLIIYLHKMKLRSNSFSRNISVLLILLPIPIALAMRSIRFNPLGICRVDVLRLTLC